MTPSAREMHSIRISTEARERLDALAEAQGRTRSDVIRRCLARGLAAEEADQAVIAKRQR
jgi:predicted transcriptional regulator